MFTANTNVASNMAANAAVMVISEVICGNAKGLSGLGGAGSVRVEERGTTEIKMLLRTF